MERLVNIFVYILMSCLTVSAIMLTVLITFLCFTKISNAAECSKEVQVIEEGQTANCSGFLFSDSAEKKAAEAKNDVIYFNKLVPRLEQKINKESERNAILEKRLDLYIRQSEVLAKDKVKSDNRKFWERVGMFMLGSLIMYGAVEVAESN